MNDVEDGQAGGGGIGWFFNHLPTIMWQRRNWLI